MQAQFNIVIPFHLEMNRSPEDLDYWLRLAKTPNTRIHFVVSPCIPNSEWSPLLEKQNVNLLQVNSPSRAEKFNQAKPFLKSEVTILHHPRSKIDIDSITKEKFEKTSELWGAFTHTFDREHPLLKFTSWYSNRVRGDIRQIFYLDHCFWVKTEHLKKMNPFKSIEIFEDTEMSLDFLKHLGPTKRMAILSKTSAIRFDQNGLFYQLILNQFVKIAYLLGVDHKWINRAYERGLNLNRSLT